MALRKHAPPRVIRLGSATWGLGYGGKTGLGVDVVGREMKHSRAICICLVLALGHSTLPCQLIEGPCGVLCNVQFECRPLAFVESVRG